MTCIFEVNRCRALLEKLFLNNPMIRILSKKYKLYIIRFQESQESITRCSADDKDKEILVPLTGSMYVPGKLSEPEKVIVDIGTGYYVEKDLDSAKEYFSKKVKYVTEQMEKVQAIGNEKNKVREMVMDIMESKLQQQFAAQQQQKATAAK